MSNTKLFELISKEYVGSEEIREIIILSGGKCGINRKVFNKAKMERKLNEKNK